MWWILAALLILITWALWYVVTGVALWIPIVASSVIAAFVIGLFIVRRIRARRAATMLERAIAQQGSQQAMNARPERRAEIQELQKQISGGISALKQSKLGGKSGGASALYSLPWYVIIGPPGAGKTTAIKHSGLVFPYAADSVRGVGGTRNCDWWFTNEAILLDTAGRYTTEHDDRDEWLAFLGMLRKYRSRRPINGILVAISITDLIDANEQQIEAIGKQIRARIDEVMTQLHMVVPVYVLFTKCDLIAGFSEYFADFRKSDRAQAWGTTLRLDEPKTEPGKIFDREFDVLVKQVHGRSLKRLVLERSREARERVYQFPLEFAGIRRNLSELVATIFAVNAFQGTPIFRGFYFTSGTQEGRPLDRVLGRMGAAMGIRTADAAAPQVVESKSYFLHDVFMNVVFPDGDIAARSASEVRRQKLMRLAVSAAALSLAAILAVPSVISYLNNQEFIAETKSRAKEAAEIEWNDGRPATDKIASLNPMLDRLLELDDHRENGEPWGMGWLMYSGDTIYKPSVAVYVSALQKGFVVPTKRRLEERLKVAKGDEYLEERTALKTYLMLSDVEHLDVDWATGKLTGVWAEMLRPSTNVPEDELKHMLVGHVRYYLTLLKTEKVAPLEPNDKLVEKVRKTLQAVPVQKRYYDQFVNVVNTEKWDEAGDNSRTNRVYPPLSLRDIFTDRPDVLEFLTSQKFQDEKRWQEVDGPYTDNGHFAVRQNIEEGRALLEREQWVVPLTEEESIKEVPKHLKRLKDEYEENYVQQWTAFVKDLTVKSPSTVKEAIELYGALSRPDWPYLRVLRTVEDHTQWRKKSDAAQQVLTTELNRRAKNRIRQATRLEIAVDINKIRVQSRVPSSFVKLVEFGVPQEGRAALTETPLAKYISELQKVREDMIEIDEATSGADPRLVGERLADARKKVQAFLDTTDGQAKRLLEPLLMTPLFVGERPQLAPAGLGGSPPPPKGFQLPPVPKLK